MTRPSRQLRVTTWPAGQGLFTHADVIVGDSCFRIVYDCGTMTFSNRRRMGDYVNSLGGKKLDLLVISHFHHDHISHISQLLKVSGGAERVWIPYLAHKTRVLYLTSLVVQATSGAIPAADYGDLTSFISDPNQWLSDRGVDEVIEIGRANPDNDTPADPEGPPQPKFNEKYPEQREYTERDYDGVEALQLEPLRRWVGAFSGSDIEVQWALLKAGQNSIHPIVNLVTWVKPLNDLKVSELLDDIGRLLVTLGYDSASDVFGARDQDNIEKLLVRLAAAMDNSANRKAISRLFWDINNDLNSNSLCLFIEPAEITDFPWSWQRAPREVSFDVAHLPWFHPYSWSNHIQSLILGPKNEQELVDYLRPYAKQWPYLLSVMRDRLPECASERLQRCCMQLQQDGDWTKLCPGTLWCGDINNSELKEILDDAIGRLPRRLDNTCLWQVPHHGSENSFLREFFEKIEMAIGVVSYGITNTHGHPCSYVANRPCSVPITEFNDPYIVSFTWR